MGLATLALQQLDSHLPHPGAQRKIEFEEDDDQLQACDQHSCQRVCPICSAVGNQCKCDPAAGVISFNTNGSQMCFKCSVLAIYHNCTEYANLLLQERGIERNNLTSFVGSEPISPPTESRVPLQSSPKVVSKLHTSSKSITSNDNSDDEDADTAALQVPFIKAAEKKAAKMGAKVVQKKVTQNAFCAPDTEFIPGDVELQVLVPRSRRSRTNKNTNYTFQQELANEDEPCNNDSHQDKDNEVERDSSLLNKDSIKEEPVVWLKRAKIKVTKRKSVTTTSDIVWLPTKPLKIQVGKSKKVKRTKTIVTTTTTTEEFY